MRRAITIAVFLSGITAGFAQSLLDPEDGLEFEVASVKPNRSGSAQSTVRILDDGSVTITNRPLRSVIAQAYGFGATLDTSQSLERFKLVGGNTEVLSARFDIAGKAPEGAIRGHSSVMLRNLLAKRFGLQVRIETRDTPVYSITLARDRALGPHLRPSKHDCASLFMAGQSMREADPDTRAICWAPIDVNELRSGVRTSTYAGPIEQLANRLQSYFDRPLIDATGLSGNFEWTITFSQSALATQNAPSVHTAFEEQLGLKLVPRTAPYEVFVVDFVDFPSPD